MLALTMAHDPRTELARLVRERGDDFANLSRLLGRNPAYVQQFVRRGTPRRLAEEDRRRLAEYFSVDEALLGAPPPSRRTGRPSAAMVSVRALDIGASAGPGTLPGGERPAAHFAFDERWLRALAAGRPADVSMIRVSGDSMMPLLADGDDILVDRGDAGERLRDGIYVLRLDDALMVKRLALNPAARTVTIKSDNNAYSDFPDCPLGSVTIIGRVLWAGRKLA